MEKENRSIKLIIKNSMNLKILQKKTNKLHRINNNTKWEKDKVPYKVSLKKVTEKKMSIVLILQTNKYK